MLFRTGPRAFRRSWYLLAGLLLATCVPAKADTGTLDVRATVVSRSLCTFTTRNASIVFDPINPSSKVPASKSTTLQFICLGFVGNTTFSLLAGNGQHAQGAGLRRLQHGTVPAELMSYNLDITPDSGKMARLAIQPVTVTATIQPSAFQNARVGSYSDVVVIQLDP